MDVFRISLGWGVGLLETGLKIFNKGILFFDVLLSSIVSMSRGDPSSLKVLWRSVTKRLKRGVMR